MTFILKNDANLTKTEVVLNDANAKFKLSTPETSGKAYKTVTVKAVKDFTMAAQGYVTVTEGAAPKLVTVGADLSGEGFGLTIDAKAAVEKLVVNGKVGALDTKATSNVEINGETGALVL